MVNKYLYPDNLLLNWLFIVGHMFSLGSTPAKQITKWHKETGPIYKINVGTQLWILISDPNLAHDVFVKAGSSTSSRPYHRFSVDIYGKNNRHSKGIVVSSYLFNNLSRGIAFSQYGPEWKNKRKAGIIFQ